MDLSAYLEKPCRFRLRSGKDVFGVIWADRETKRLCFASSRDFSLLRKANRQLREAINWYPLDRDEVIAAELLDTLIPRP